MLQSICRPSLGLALRKLVHLEDLFTSLLFCWSLLIYFVTTTIHSNYFRVNFHHFHSTKLLKNIQNKVNHYWQEKHDDL